MASSKKPLDRVLDLLPEPRPCGAGYVARCPAHEDQHASLSVGVNEQGSVLLTCHAGCSTESVARALNLELADLFHREEPDKPKRTSYSLVDANGDTVALHIREDGPDGKRFWWERDGKPGLGGIKGSDLPLYRLPALLRSDESVPVVVTEGEKAADALTRMGILAVATVTGASSTPSDDVLMPLLGRDVILWPDADTVGQRHMQRVGQRLVSMGARPRVVHVDGAQEHDDAWDYLRREGADLPALLARSTALVNLDPEPAALPVSHPFVREGMGWRYTPPEGYGVVWHVDRVTKNSDGVRARLRVECVNPAIGLPIQVYRGRHLLEGPNSIRDLVRALKEASGDQHPITPSWQGQAKEAIRLVLDAEEAGEPFRTVGLLTTDQAPPDLVELILPYRKTTQLYAPGGVGKGWIATALGIHVTLGQPFQNLAVRQGGVLYLDWEDDPETLDIRIKKLCRGLGVPPVEFHYRQCASPLYEQVAQVAAYVDQHHIELVIIDSAALAGGAGGGERYEDVGLRLMAAIRHLNATCLLIDHVAGDSVKGDGIAKKGYGTVFKGNLARLTWSVVKQQEVGSKVSRVAMYQTKINHGPMHLPIALALDFRLDDRVTIELGDVRDTPELAAGLSLAPRIDHYLAHNGAQTAATIAQALSLPKEVVKEETVRRTLNRYEKEGRYVRVNQTDNDQRVLWGLAMQGNSAHDIA